MCGKPQPRLTAQASRYRPPRPPWPPSPDIRRSLPTRPWTISTLSRPSLQPFLPAHPRPGPPHGRYASILLRAAPFPSPSYVGQSLQPPCHPPTPGLARAVAATYAPQGIRVNCVAPGLTPTRQTKAFTQVRTHPKGLGAGVQLRGARPIANIATRPIRWCPRARGAAAGCYRNREPVDSGLGEWAGRGGGLARTCRVGLGYVCKGWIRGGK